MSQRRVSKLGRWSNALAVVLGVPTVAVVLWGAAHLALRKPAPPPRWSEANLPALPPSDENGWSHVEAVQVAGVGTPPELMPLLDSIDAGAPGLLAAARPLREALARHLDDAPAAALREVMLQALDRPRFADACPISLESRCPYLRVLQAHRLAALSALRLADGGDWKGSLGLSARLLAADVDLASTSRSLISHQIALDDLRRSTGLALSLWTAFGAEPGRPPNPDPAAAARAAERLRALSFDALGAQRAIEVENLLFRSALLDPDSPLTSPVHSALLDVGRTLDEVDRRTAALLACAADPALPVPPVTLERQGAFWWLSNPTGKTLLDGMELDFAPHLKKIEERRRLLLERRPKLLALLGG